MCPLNKRISFTEIPATVYGTTGDIFAKMFTMNGQINCRLRIICCHRPVSTETGWAAELVRDTMVWEVRWSDALPGLGNRP